MLSALFWNSSIFLGEFECKLKERKSEEKIKLHSQGEDDFFDVKEMFICSIGSEKSWFCIKFCTITMKKIWNLYPRFSQPPNHVVKTQISLKNQDNFAYKSNLPMQFRKNLYRKIAINFPPAQWKQNELTTNSYVFPINS